MLPKINGIYQHLVNGKLYQVTGFVRCVINPNQEKVLYKQLYQSKLNGTNTILPIGTNWIRDIDDFNKKFLIK